MSLLALCLVLLSAVIHAIWNLSAKKGGGTTRFAFQTALAIGVAWAPINLYFAFQYPLASPSTWSGFAWIIVAFSAAVHALYFVVLLHGYKAAPLSVVYPVARGIGPLISAFAAILLFNEVLSWSTFTGIILIVVGVVLISWKGGSQELTDPKIRHGVLWGSATGLFIALYTLIDAYAIKTLGLHPIPYDYFVNGLRAVMILPFIGGVATAFTLSPEQRKAVIVVALLGPAAYILVLFAMQLAPLSHVAPARELSLLFGTFLGGKILNEGHTGRKMVAAAFIAVGVIMLTI